MELLSQPVLNISNYVTIKLTVRNYILWKTQFEAFLSGQGLLGFITGTTQQPAVVMPVPNIKGYTGEASNPEHIAWERTDQIIREWLLGSLSEDILSEVVAAPTSRDIWLALANLCNRISFSRFFALRRRLYTLSKGNKTMSDYLKEIKNLCEQLSSIGNPVSENMKILAALHGLGKEYEPIRTCIEGSMDLLPSATFEDVIPRLTRFDDRLLCYTYDVNVTPNLVFNKQRFQPEGFYRNNNRGRGISYHRFDSNRGLGSFPTKGRGFHQQITQPPEASQSSYSSDTRSQCQICGKLGHSAVKCWHRFDNAY